MPGRVFAIGDVHGCADELDELLGLLPLEPDSKVIFLGDYIDRGPNSRGVIDRILALKKTHDVVTLRGNHEAMLLEFLAGDVPAKVARFILNGGTATLATYGGAAWEIPEEHIAFFRDLRISHATARHFFVHAGVPDVPLAALDPEIHAHACMWVRNSFLKSDFRWEKMIVHGHTVVPQVEITSKRIDLDTGCAYGLSLSAMEFPSYRVYSVPCRVPPARALLRDNRSSARRSTVRFHGAIPVEVTLRNGTTMQVETIDYSEVGLGILVRRLDDAAKLHVGMRVSGLIGPPDLFQIPFDGVVVRSSFNGLGDVYGLTIDLGDLGPTPAPP